jgi:hypothetical protein
MDIKKRDHHRLFYDKQMHFISSLIWIALIKYWTNDYKDLNSICRCYIVDFHPLKTTSIQGASIDKKITLRLSSHGFDVTKRSKKLRIISHSQQMMKNFLQI